MDPIRNPFAPGAGSRPPELAGREKIIQDAQIALQRVLIGRSAQSQIFRGLRGTGKTVLLNEIYDMAEDAGYHVSFLEAPEDKALTEMLYPAMSQVLRKLSAMETAKEQVRQGLRALRGFASAFKIKLAGIQVDVKPEPGLADSGNLELDLAEMFEAIGRAAKAAGRGWLLLIDELQYLDDSEWAAVIMAVHRMSQRNLPVVVFAGGLPQIAKLSGEAKSYSERLFLYPQFGPLEEPAAKDAIRKPLEEERVMIEADALDRLYALTAGYPYFLQLWGYHAWLVAEGSPITRADVEAAHDQAVESLDTGFFQVRLDRLTEAEADYVRAMARLGQGPYPVGDIAKALGKTAKSLGPRRAAIIEKGMIYTPSYGTLDFTVPLFDDFLRRTENSA